MKTIWSWIVTVFLYFSPSFEGEDGKFSYRRVMQYTFGFLIVYMVMKGDWSVTNYFYAFLTICVLYALSATLMTVQQLIQLTTAFRYGKGQQILDNIQGEIEPGAIEPGPIEDENKDTHMDSSSSNTGPIGYLVRHTTAESSEESSSSDKSGS